MKKSKFQCIVKNIFSFQHFQSTIELDYYHLTTITIDEGKAQELFQMLKIFIFKKKKKDLVLT